MGLLSFELNRYTDGKVVLVISSLNKDVQINCTPDELIVLKELIEEFFETNPDMKPRQ